jgi:hypothetical protein
MTPTRAKEKPIRQCVYCAAPAEHPMLALCTSHDLMRLKDGVSASVIEERERSPHRLITHCAGCKKLLPHVERPECLGFNEEIVKRALLSAASDILADLEIEVNTETGVMSWPDPTVIPDGPRSVNRERLINLARAVMAASRCWGTTTPAATTERRS